MAYVINSGKTLNSTITTSSLNSGTISVTGATGAAGSSVLSGGINGTHSIWYDNSVNTTKDVLTIKPNALDVKGDATFHGKLNVDGVDIGQSLKKIEERLGILRPNLELESRWEELKELRRKYTELETEILEKEELIRILAK